eukprot:544842-Rhodomonas_salina.4
MESLVEVRALPRLGCVRTPDLRPSGNADAHQQSDHHHHHHHHHQTAALAFVGCRRADPAFDGLVCCWQEWAQDGLPAQVIRGPVKQTERALQKCVRVYRRDPAYLADLVRCTVVFRTISDIELFLRCTNPSGHGGNAWRGACR